jgi:hypothetical protein
MPSKRKITVELTEYEAFIVRKALKGFAKNTAKDQGLAATSFSRGLLDSSQEQTALAIAERLEL